MSVEQVLDLLRCAVCREPFTADHGLVRCSNGHSYDLARQGYLNLLGRAAPANADTTEMVAARSRFLSAGHYDPIAAALAELVCRDGPTVLDVGAGNGHYLARVLAGRGGRGVALDISPAACRRAARAQGRIGAVVADAWAPLPLADGVFDVVLSVFAPRQPSEFARVLAPNGMLLVVTPLPDHLIELRSGLDLLGVGADKEDRLLESLGTSFEQTKRRECRSRLSLDPGAVHDVVSMGPNAFHQDPDALGVRIRTLLMPMAVTMSIAITAWTKPSVG